MNVGEAAKANPGPAGGGGVIRGHLGNWILGFAANFGTCSSRKAELLALLKGLRLARQRGSQVAIRKVLEPLKDGQIHHQIIKECQQLIRLQDWVVKITHCFREANKVADHLANMRVDQNELFVSFDSPSILLILDLVEDISGVAWPRLVNS